MKTMGLNKMPAPENLAENLAAALWLIRKNWWSKFGLSALREAAAADATMALPPGAETLEGQVDVILRAWQLNHVMDMFKDYVDKDSWRPFCDGFFEAVCAADLLQVDEVYKRFVNGAGRHPAWSFGPEVLRAVYGEQNPGGFWRADKFLSPYGAILAGQSRILVARSFGDEDKAKKIEAGLIQLPDFISSMSVSRAAESDEAAEQDDVVDSPEDALRVAATTHFVLEMRTQAGEWFPCFVPPDSRNYDTLEIMSALKAGLQESDPSLELRIRENFDVPVPNGASSISDSLRKQEPANESVDIDRLKALQSERREHPYGFQHDLLPSLFFQHPARFVATFMNSERARPILKEFWDEIGEKVEAAHVGTKLDFEGTRAELDWVGDRPCILIHFPDPLRLPECYMLAAVLNGVFSDGPRGRVHTLAGLGAIAAGLTSDHPDCARLPLDAPQGYFFTLERGISGTDEARTVLCSWDQEHRHSNHSDGPPPNRVAFLSAIHSILFEAGQA